MDMLSYGNFLVCSCNKSTLLYPSKITADNTFHIHLGVQIATEVDGRFPDISNEGNTLHYLKLGILTTLPVIFPVTNACAYAQSE
jgi:hypothetical protein